MDQLVGTISNGISQLDAYRMLTCECFIYVNANVVRREPVSGFTVLLYDTLLSLPDEVEYIWPAAMLSVRANHSTRIVMMVLLFTRVLMTATAIESLFSKSSFEYVSHRTKSPL